MRRTAAFLATGLVCSLLAACDTPKVGRVGPPVSLPNGAPKSPCERKNWHELAPARVTSTAMTAGIGYNTIYTKNHEGLGVFRLQEKDPSELKDLWPMMAETKLQERHQARIQPVDDASRQSATWALGGLAGLGVGVGIAAATSDSSPDAATVFGVTGLVIGLVGAVGALATQPSGHAQLEAEARRKLFIPKEDDLVAAARGVNRLNGAQRQRCGGKATPFPEQTKPSKQPPAAQSAAANNSPSIAPIAPPEPSAGTNDSRPIARAAPPAPSAPAPPEPATSAAPAPIPNAVTGDADSAAALPASAPSAQPRSADDTTR